MKTKLYWASHMARNAPGLAAQTIPLGLHSRLNSAQRDPQILVGTHHKALTVFMSRVFRAFAAITNRSCDAGAAYQIDHRSTVLIDHHSTFDWDAVRDGFIGLHVIRDPRDIIVSSAHYHCVAGEEWLHRPMEHLDGRTYQQAIRALPDFEDRLLFEIREASGRTIADMLAWDYSRAGICEFRYADLVGEGASECFQKGIGDWPLVTRERQLLARLFDYFSLGGAGAKTGHVRSAAVGQWQNVFTAKVEDAFQAAFPDALDRLGYS